MARTVAAAVTSTMAATTMTAPATSVAGGSQLRSEQDEERGK
jgi:hypothetical protein